MYSEAEWVKDLNLEQIFKEHFEIRMTTETPCMRSLLAYAT